MRLSIEFMAIGLPFRAEVSYSHGFPGSFDEPREYQEVQILELECYDHNAFFLMESNVVGSIQEAAEEATEETLSRMRESNQEDQAASHYDWALVA